MNFLLLAIIVYAVARFAGIPDTPAIWISVFAGGIEAIASLDRWTAAYNARKLKRVVHE